MNGKNSEIAQSSRCESRGSVNDGKIVISEEWKELHLIMILIYVLINSLLAR